MLTFYEKIEYLAFLFFLKGFFCKQCTCIYMWLNIYHIFNMWILTPKNIYNQGMRDIYISSMWENIQVYFTIACEFLFTI